MPALPTAYKNILQVFSDGLIHGLVSRKEIIAWADNKIRLEDEPDYFLIELSLCEGKSISDIVEIIAQVTNNQSSDLTERVLLAISYHKLIDAQIALANVIPIIYIINHSFILTAFESSIIFDLDMQYDAAQSADDHYLWETLLNDTINFLKYYEELNLNNFKEWELINERIDALVKSDEQSAYRSMKLLERPYTIKSHKQKVTQVIIVIALAGILSLFIYLTIYNDNLRAEKFNYAPFVTIFIVLMLRAISLKSTKS